MSTMHVIPGISSYIYGGNDERLKYKANTYFLINQTVRCADKGLVLYPDSTLSHFSLKRHTHGVGM